MDDIKKINDDKYIDSNMNNKDIPNSNEHSDNEKNINDNHLIGSLSPNLNEQADFTAVSAAAEDIHENVTENIDQNNAAGENIIDNINNSNQNTSSNESNAAGIQTADTLSNSDDIKADTENKPKPVKKTKGQTYKKLKRMMKTTKTMAICNSRVEMYKYLAKQFDKLDDYKKSQELAEKCRKKAKKTKKLIKKQIYETALEIKSNAKKPDDYKLAAAQFRKIPGYLDADELASQCDELAIKLEKSFTIRRIGIFTFIIAAFASCIVFIKTPFAKYELANFLMNTKSYDSAIKIYSKLGAYNDSVDKKSESYYKKAINLMEEGSLNEALKAITAAGDYKDSQEIKANIEKLIIKQSFVDDTVKFGKYDWRIMDINGNKALLMKKAPLTDIAYNNSLSEVTWESSSLRLWLNSDFLADAFSEEERRSILLSRNTNNSNPLTGIDGGNDTDDYIFILNIDEAKKYKDLIPKSDYNLWLRTPGNTKSRAAFISSDKKIMENGYEVNSDMMAVKPVLWLNLD